MAVRRPLRVASFSGHLGVVKYLISQRADTEIGDNYSYTPLHVASEKGHLYIATCLLDAGADVNKPSSDGNLSLLAASRGGYLDIIKYLITKGAPIESRNNYGWTVIHFAADNGHLESLEYFLRNNTSVSSGNSHNVLKVGLQVWYSVQTALTKLSGRGSARWRKILSQTCVWCRQVCCIRWEIKDGSLGISYPISGFEIYE